MTVLEIPTPDPRTLDEAARPFAEAVASQYAIKRMIGRGGMGIVYLARDRRLERLVAIKTLLPQLAADAVVRERFVRETRTAGGMSHPNIVPVHGADEIAGHVFFVMGYVEGESLAARVRAHGRLAPRIVAGHLRDVAAALAHAHGRGIIHRDIKAENILIERRTGLALVTDFGIARLVDAAPLTATGQLLGTVYYVSPEQVAGERIDARTDLYSLGVVAYLALTGRFPFDGELASAVLVAHVTKAAPPVISARDDVPPALAALVDRCLAKRPADRFANADELLVAIDRAITEMERGGTTPNDAGPLVSDTEAQALWQRAAELQALTGVQPRPAPVPQSRDATKDRARASGFAVGQIRAAASEAGIDRRYVDHALVEHGLSALPTTGPAKRGRFQIVREATVGGELPAREFDRIVHVLRDGTASLGITDAAAGELRWYGAWLGHRLTVSVVPTPGRTTVRLTQGIGRAAAGAYLGAVAVMGGVVGPAVGLLCNMLMNMPAPVWGMHIPSPTIAGIAIGSGAFAALASIPLGQALAQRIRHYNAARLTTLAELITVRVREAIVGDKSG